MFSFDGQKQRNDSRSCNENVLLDIGFLRLGNSSLFRKSNVYILSPGISKGLHEKYWFDIREANLQKIENVENAWILLRIVPNWFAFFKIDCIYEMMNEKTQDIRSNSGLVYGFYCKLYEQTKRIEVIAKNDQSALFSVKLHDLNTIKDIFDATIFVEL